MSAARARQANQKMVDRLIAEGEACIDRNDLDGLRRVIGQILENQYPTSAKKAASAALAGLMK